MEHIDMSIANVSWPQCLADLKANKNAYLIDVRTEEEWQDTGIVDLNDAKDSILLSWIITTPYIRINSNFLSEISKLVEDKNANLYFLCKSGNRSGQAANASCNAGYSNCFNLIHGFVEDIPRRKRA